MHINNVIDHNMSFCTMFPPETVTTEKYLIRRNASLSPPPTEIQAAPAVANQKENDDAMCALLYVLTACFSLCALCPAAAAWPQRCVGRATAATFLLTKSQKEERKKPQKGGERKEGAVKKSHQFPRHFVATTSTYFFMLCSEKKIKRGERFNIVFSCKLPRECRITVA